MIIKDKPEDFIVEEIPLEDFQAKDIGSADYAIYKLWKKNLNTEEAVQIVCDRFHIDRRKIKYAGTKDRNAQTTQYISIINDRGQFNIDGKDLKLSHMGFSSQPLSLGMLKGNKFCITVRNLTENEKANFGTRIKDMTYFPNYFDDQRFSLNNFDIGLCMLKKDYKGAISKILESDGSYEKNLREYLEGNPNNYIGALGKIPKKILSMYLHSVQSRIFNEALSKRLYDYSNSASAAYRYIEYTQGKLTIYENSQEYTNIKQLDDGKLSVLQLPGFDTVLDDDFREIFKRLEITPRDFIIRSIPDLSMDSSLRECFAEIKSFSHTFDPGSNTLVLDFFLPKGCYATMLIKILLL